MGGGLMQLVAYGAQDIYLTGNPQITFFKVVYRRHTNFSIESIEQTFNGTAGFGKKINCAISRSGDLASSMLLDVTLKMPETMAAAITVPNASWAASPFLGHRLIKYADIEIGGQRIDRHYGEWMHIWSQLVLAESKKTGFEEMIGHKLGVVATTGATTWKAPYNPFGTNGNWYQLVHLQIPLQFWFCRNPGLALPLIALQYHDVKIVIEFNDARDCFNEYTTTTTWTTGTSGGPSNLKGSAYIEGASLWVDYIYLDTDERRRFAQLTHTYLIEQVQHPGEESCSAGTNNLKLPFNHPVKELVWVIQNGTHTASGEWYNYTNTSVVGNPFAPGGSFGLGVTTPVAANFPLNNCEQASIKLNSQDRISERRGDYFNQTQPYYHHTRIPYTGINCYSFALRPEEHQPSGTCNFSRIDNASLYFSARTGSTTIKVFAINYNILRIMSGMAGLAYSN